LVGSLFDVGRAKKTCLKRFFNGVDFFHKRRFWEGSHDDIGREVWEDWWESSLPMPLHDKSQVLPGKSCYHCMDHRGPHQRGHLPPTL